MPLANYWKIILDAAPDALVIVDQDGCIQYASAHVERLFGFAPDELVGVEVEMLLPSELRDAHVAHRRGYMEDPGVRPMSLRSPLRAQRRDGSRFPAHVSLSPVEFDGRRHILASVRDITELEDVRSDLEQSRKRLRDLIEHMPDAVAVHRHGVLLYVNSALLNYLGYESADELVGTPIMEIIHPDDRKIAADRLARMRLTGVSAPPVEERFIKRDGSYITAEIHVQPMEFDGEESFVVIGRDLTHKKKLLARAMQLDRKHVVGTLATGVAHEINNPLAYAKSNIDFVLRELREALSDDSGLDRQRLHNLVDAIGDTSDGLDRIGQIVGDLNTFADHHGDTLAPVAVDEVLEASINLVFRRLDSRAHVVRELQEVPRVHANKGQLAEVFVNLLTNALNAVDRSERDGNEVRISTGRVDGGVLVEITDTGCGMSPEVLQSAFDPFFSTSKEGEGTGLGLTIVRNTVERLGGRVEVDSTPGEGTHVRVWLPALEAGDEPTVVEDTQSRLIR